MVACAPVMNTYRRGGDARMTEEPSGQRIAQAVSVNATAAGRPAWSPSGPDSIIN